MKEPIYYLNGKFVKKGKACVSVYDMGFLRSFGAVDFLITYNGKPFRLGKHLDRFYRSAKLVGVTIPCTKAKLRELVSETLAKNCFSESAIWLIVTGGVGPTSMIPAKKSTLVIMVDPHKAYPKACYTRGVKIITFKGERLLPEAKSMVYTLAIKALGEAYKKKAVEALYIVDGKITECMTSNFFIFKNGTLYTAKDVDVLKGITREVVFQIARGHFQVKKKDLSLKDVFWADEAFLTPSNKEVMPVVRVDNCKIGDGKVGKETRELMLLFDEFVGKK